MKKILFLMLSFASLHAGIEIHTSILCKEPTSPGYYRWADKLLVDFVMNMPVREVITYCDGRGFWGRLFNDNYRWEWCKQPVKKVNWKYLKDYYVFTLQAPGCEEEEIAVTGDQLFKCTECSADDVSNLDKAWVSAEKLAKRYDEDNIACTTIYCSPKSVDGKPARRTARIVHITKIEEKHNQPKEFFSLTIDDARTYLIGKGHYWVLGD